MRTILFAVGILCAARFDFALADEDTLFQRMQNTPISVFTFGLYKLDQEMLRIGRDEISYGEWDFRYMGKARYDYLNNRIILSFEAARNVAQSIQDGSQTLEEACKDVVETVRGQGGVRNNEDDPSLFALMFMDDGSRLEDLRKLDDLMHISVKIGAKNCTAPFLGSSFFIEKH